ncbi:lysophospholipid acyltransferase family protein [Alkalibacter saccharofermentans]|nr:lysophospholipid acyltransferase family protein [Alkalibacter saccharofermentans]
MNMFYDVAKFLVNIFLSIYYKFDIRGKENIPKGVPLIISSNHIHWADPVIVACRTGKRHISFLGKRELFKNKIFSWVLHKLTVIPVRRGEADVNAIKSALRVLKNGKVLGIFPEGTRVKEGVERDPQSGLVVLALKSKCDVIPVGLRGNYKFRSTIHINVGEPISLKEYYGVKNDKEKLKEISLMIMERIKELAKG